jgi:glycosyltransferase involved in cell wall biosynthesis
VTYGHEKQKLPRVAWFSRFNREGKSPISSFAAYTSDTLLPIVHQGFEVDLYGKEDGEVNTQRIRHYLSALRHHKEDPYDLFFYNLDDSEESNFIRMHMGVMPGVTLFHDLLLKSEDPAPLTFSVWPELLKEFNFGSNAVSVKKYGQPDRGAFAFREIALSPISLFASPRLVGEARRLAKESLARIPNFMGTDKLYLPYPVTVPRHMQPVRDSNSAPRIGFFGAPSIENRAAKVCQAMRDIKGEFVWMLPSASLIQAKEMAHEYGLLNVTFVEDSSPLAWSRLVGGLDVAVHTYFSLYGTLGPCVQMSLATGVPTIVTSFAESEFLPNSVVFKVEPGHQEVNQIRATIQSILDLDRRELDVIGANCRAFAAENNSAEIVGRELCAVFSRARAILEPFYRRWSDVNSWGRSEVIAANLHDYDESLVGDTFKEMGWR